MEIVTPDLELLKVLTKSEVHIKVKTKVTTKGFDLSGKGCILFHAIFHNSWVGELCYDTVRLDLMTNNDA